MMISFESWLARSVRFAERVERLPFVFDELGRCWGIVDEDSRGNAAVEFGSDGRAGVYSPSDGMIFLSEDGETFEDLIVRDSAWAPRVGLEISED